MPGGMFQPTRMHAPHGATELVIEWNDGPRSILPHQLLRGLCPCAVCQGHSGAVKWVTSTEEASRFAFEIKDLKIVGNYAISLEWADGHSTGIYPFVYLRKLSEFALKSRETWRELKLSVGG